VILQSFATRANISRFKYLTNIENELVEGGVSDATTHLGLTPSSIISSMKIDTVTGVEIDDDSTVDYLVNTYKVFYTLHLNYKTHSMTSSDSSRIINIAELCPLEYGAVVYQARALYTAVFQEVRIWNDTCVDFVDTTGQQQDEQGHKTGNGKGNAAKEDMQQYRLYPNPNDGNIVIVQMVEDTGKIITTVTDVAGRVVYRDNVAFIEGNYRLNLNKLSVGMYLMELTDDRGRKYNFKFVKQW
jgi:hypothetical protein